MAKIGILGGSFHPIHNGHLMLGQYCLDKKIVSEVWFIPTGVSYLKAGMKMLTGEERLHLVELAIQGNPKMKALDVEIKRPGNTYTVETLEELKKLHPEHEFFFIIGADCLFSMETWYRAKDIFQSARLLVARRDGKSLGEMQRKARDLKDRFGASVRILRFEEMDISSTMIRERFAKGKSANDLMPKAVSQEIKKRGYFKEA
ncbi:MAG: nicotinate-nucleotide adenylyltransferase [Lachnospiraceae bacterium]|nr:nicotinate-nucleotide adenylyltransferase [Lachnospiraceae bacterium]